MQRRRNDAEAAVDGVEAPIQQSSPRQVVSRKKSRPKTRQQQQQREDESSSSSSSNTAFVLKFSFLMMIVLVASYFLVAHHEELQLEHLRENIIHEEIEPLSKEWEEKYAALEEENIELKRKTKSYENLEAESERLKEQYSQQQRAREKLDKRLDYLANYKAKMQDNIKLMSKTALVEKFGPGPYHVEIIVEFHPDFQFNEDNNNNNENNDENNRRGTIQIQLADKDAMPHTVYWFLEQVTRKLYDGCSFHRNAGHVVQGGPAPNFLSPPNPHLEKRFKDAGFHSVLFQEYSELYPHQKYTMGFAGRPGGPDFYFSTQDNTKVHGPGGQTSYENPSEADPCFAKVIEGFEVVDKMHKSPVKPGGYKAMENNVAIVSMTLMGYDGVAGGNTEIQ